MPNRLDLCEELGVSSGSKLFGYGKWKGGPIISQYPHTNICTECKITFQKVTISKLRVCVEYFIYINNNFGVGNCPVGNCPSGESSTLNSRIRVEALSSSRLSFSATTARNGFAQATPICDYMLGYVTMPTDLTGIPWRDHKVYYPARVSKCRTNIRHLPLVT